MASSVIGALRVNLGLNSAQFNNGLKNAVKSTGLFTARMKTALSIIGLVASTLGTAGVAFRLAMNRADDMGKSAQKLGVGVEALLKLRYAAELADVSFETLGTSVGRLSRNMAEASAGSPKIAAAFASVGVAVTNADGSLRNAEDVLLELSNVFAAMPDGAQKTALAMQLMGRSGAEMIPLLNDGSAALRSMGEEAERAGVVITQKTADAAERFNDSLTRMKGSIQGIVIQIAADLAPMMAETAEELAYMAANFRNVGNIASEVFSRIVTLGRAAATGLHGVALSIESSFRGAFATILSVAGATFSALPGLGGLGGATTDAGTLAAGEASKTAARAAAAMSNASLMIKDAMAPLKSIIHPIQTARKEVEALGTEFEETAGGGGGGGGGAKELSTALDELKTKAESVFSETRTPQEQFAAKLAELNTLVRAGLIDWDTYGRAVTKAQDELTEVGTVGKTAFDSLGDSIVGLVEGTETLADTFRNLLRSVGTNLVNTGLGSIGKALNIPGFANGTNFAPGGLALVGEHRPELVNLPRGSRVLPNLNALGGGVMNVNISLAGANGNAEVAAVAQAAVERGLAMYDRTVPDRVMKIRRDRHYRG